LSPKRDGCKALGLGSGRPHGEDEQHSRRPFLAATLRDGAIWAHFVAVGRLVYVEYTAASAV